MTRPVRPASSIETAARQGRGIESLARRPAPVFEASIPSATFIVDEMSISTSFTDVDFTNITNDTSDGTLWDLSGGNCRILAGGTYRVEYVFSDITTTGGVDTVFFAQVNVSSGSVGLWSAKQLSGSAQELYHQSILRLDALSPPWTSVQVLNPQMASYAVWNDGDTFPAVLQLQAYVEEDGSGVAKTPDIKMFIARHGNTP